MKNAIQYTVPIEAAVDRVRSGSEPELTTREKHLRECYVVPEEGADLKAIEEAIKTMPNYFDEYDTTVTFITEEELKEQHSSMPHGGFVIRSGETGTEGSKHIIEYSLKLDSNRNLRQVFWYVTQERRIGFPGRRKWRKNRI